MGISKITFVVSSKTCMNDFIQKCAFAKAVWHKRADWNVTYYIGLKSPYLNLWVIHAWLIDRAVPDIVYIICLETHSTDISYNE